MQCIIKSHLVQYLGCPTWYAKVCKTTPLQYFCKGLFYWSRNHTIKLIWLQNFLCWVQFKTYCTVTKYRYVTKMQLFRMKESINYNPAIMILCMLAYTDHSPSSTLKYHRNPILWPYIEDIYIMLWPFFGDGEGSGQFVCIYVQYHDGRLSGCIPSWQRYIFLLY